MLGSMELKEALSFTIFVVVGFCAISVKRKYWIRSIYKINHASVCDAARITASFSCRCIVRWKWNDVSEKRDRNVATCIQRIFSLLNSINSILSSFLFLFFLLSLCLSLSLLFSESLSFSLLLQRFPLPTD